MSTIQRLVRFLTSPLFQLAMAVVLFLTGGFEIVSMVLEERHEIGAHHGVTLYGLAGILKALSELFEGAYGSAEVFVPRE